MTYSMSSPLFSRSHKIEIMLKYYKQLQIVNILFHNLCKKMVFPAITFILLSFTAISMYATIKLYDDVKFPGFLGCPVSIIAPLLIAVDAFPQLFRVYELSENLIRDNLQLVTRGSNDFKHVRACRPLKIFVGYFYFIGRSTFLTFLTIIIDNTIDALLTF